MTLAEWAATQSASAWGRLSIRDGEKGEVMADSLSQRVWVWEGEALSASRWHLLVRREIDGTKLMFGLSNAKPSASLRRLAEMQGARHFVEHSFQEAKSACGMAEYQVRRWQACIDGGTKPWNPLIASKLLCSKHQIEMQSEKVELDFREKSRTS
ncbi:MAG: hypothetical protein JNL84_00175 [Candidatus Accumulibacter sp.]|nr:hypothetical protein [Accumulibacter sp.]